MRPGTRCALRSTWTSGRRAAAIAIKERNIPAISSFYNLSPDVIMQAVEREGFKPTGYCQALNSYENRVYDLAQEDGTHVVAKFYRPGRWSRDQIREEHELLFELRGDEIPVCAPLMLAGGSTIGEILGIAYAVWPRTGGRAPDEPSDMVLEMLGRLLARIHNRCAVRKAEHRIALTGKTYGLDPLALLEQRFLPAHLRERYRSAVLAVVELYEAIRKDVPFHRIHGDCHLGNILQGNEGWFFLDFDDFLTGPAVQDVWMLVPARDKEGLRQREVFLGAYRQFREFQDSWLRLIEPLRALRYIRYAAWIAERWEDPAFPAAFPHFGTPQYWEDETRDLEAQVEYFHRHPDDVPPGLKRQQAIEEEKELTNKDFFWDLEE
jgi:Ser/Thr protein kinase RdoA (MazF antagonist)